MSIFLVRIKNRDRYVNVPDTKICTEFKIKYTNSQET